MAYTNSPLVNYTKLSPNHSGQRTHKIDRISPHCVVGQCSVETLGSIFYPSSRQASCQYGIGYDGRVGMYCEEKNRSWCTSSNANDQRAITIEVASDTTHPYAMKDAAYKKLIELCIDICKRNGATKLIWFADKNKSLNYEPKNGEMVITVHRWFANKSCPGDWLYSRLGDLAAKVTAALNPSQSSTDKNETANKVLYKVQVGAFKNETNANNLKKELESKGFQTYKVKINGYWKIQLGAFSKKSNAEALLTKVKNAGYKDAFITVVGNETKPVTGGSSTSNATQTKPATTQKIKEKDTVRVKKGAKTYTGGNLADFVYTRDHIVSELSGKRAVITYGGEVVAAVNVDNLTLVKKNAGTSSNSSATKTFHKNDKVRVVKGAKSYTGGGLADFVYSTVYTVLEEPSGDRVVIGINGQVTAAVNAKNLYKA